MSNKRIIAALAGISTLVVGILAAKLFWFTGDSSLRNVQPPTVQSLDSLGLRISGPYTSKNLTIFLIHGTETLEGKVPSTLEEALKMKSAVVHETASVNQLAIENLSPDTDLYVQSGDIVKGGQQDRVLAVDLVVPPKSGRLPIDSFCVEQGRWTARGSESRSKFDSSSEALASKELKLAAKRNRSQGEVWNQVANSQVRLSAATNSNTAATASNSSLQLTLEHPRVLEDAQSYVRDLEDVVDGSGDAIGFIMIINGGINSADMYNSSELFRKLWPKMLNAAAKEAVAASLDKPQGSVTAESIEAFLVSGTNGRITDDRKVTDLVRLITREQAEVVVFDTSYRNSMLHRSYLAL